MMTPIACEKVSRPALTKPITVRMAAVEDWTNAVKTGTGQDRAQASGNEPQEGLPQGIAREVLSPSVR